VSLKSVLGIPGKITKRVRSAALNKVKRLALGTVAKHLTKIAKGGRVRHRRRRRRGRGFTRSRIRW